MTKDEALKLALEALSSVGWHGGGSCWEVDPDKIEEATIAIKEALAQPAQKPRLDQGPDYERGFVDGRLYQTQTSVDKAVNAIAQPAQEPVAEVVEDYFSKQVKGINNWHALPNGTKLYTTAPAAQPAQEPVAWGYRSKDGEIYDCISPEAHADAEGDYTVPLYAAPFKRPWVGLTGQEIEAAWRAVETSDFYDCVVPLSRAVEAKLKEKNT